MADRTRTRLLNALKTAGPLSAAELAKTLAVTPVAIRQQLDRLHQDGLAGFEDLKGSVGRPKRLWSLTASGHAQFPDSHPALALGLLDAIADLHGDSAVDALINHREAAARRSYATALSGMASPRARVEALAELRSREGYMAHVESVEDEFLLIENHCSICAVATVHAGFCRSELTLFQKVLGSDTTVEREEHLLSGGRRCVYRIRDRRAEAA